jgi:exopolysaccharide biosynthesis polyprenyl glycosylphosphotransferase
MPVLGVRNVLSALRALAKGLPHGGCDDMLYHNVRVIGAHLWLADAMAIGALSAGTCWIGAQYGVLSAQADGRAVVTFCASIVLAFLILSARMRAYHTRRTEKLTKELSVLFEVTVYSVALACLAAVTLTQGLSARAYLLVLAVDSLGLLVLRLLTRILLRRLRRKGDDYRVWLVVGHNARAARLIDAILTNPHFGIRLAAVVDLAHKGEARGEPVAPSTERPQLRLLHGLEEFRQMVGSTVIDEVVVTLPLRSYYDEMQAILDICCEAGISVKMQPEPFARSSYRTEVSELDSIPMVTHFTGPSNHVHLAIKRSIDMLGAALGLILLMPLLLGIALAIKLDSPGPVFYRALRVGLHGRHFRMLKFRSMVRDAEQRQQQLRHLNETDGVAFKIRDDPRITRVGKLFRKFHLDELPQLWNVLLGDMSLVGPRPLPISEAHGNEWWQRRRLSMPPGLTCFWQVASDHRMPFHQWAELDLNYIDRWSVWLDIKLIASTLSTLVRGKGW